MSCFYRDFVVVSPRSLWLFFRYLVDVFPGTLQWCFLGPCGGFCEEEIALLGLNGFTAGLTLRSGQSCAAPREVPLMRLVPRFFTYVDKRISSPVYGSELMFCCCVDGLYCTKKATKHLKK